MTPRRTLTQAQLHVLAGIREPATHHTTRDAAGTLVRAPLCGQVAAGGLGPARTRYTDDPERVTCRKCRAAIERQRAKAVA